MSETSSTPGPCVFISYTHDNVSHKERVLELSERLRTDGIETVLDQYHETNPPIQGWPRWMEDEIGSADFVVVVCTETYYKRFRGHELPGRGYGAQWEGAIITQDLYDHAAKTNKFIPIGFDSYGANSSYIPSMLKSKNYYDVSTESGYEDLYRQLTGQHAVVPSPIGTILKMPTRSQTTTGDGPANP